jgi:acetylornithine deacetylase/succinyl-diaminopimelate desuccinylase-like protein
VVPVIAGWFTDSHWFRELGIISYGFMPVEMDAEHLATMHGKNERIPLQALTNGVRRMHETLLNLCTTP